MTHILLLAAFGLFFIVDISTDLQEGVPFTHLMHEMILFGISLAAIVWQLYQIVSKDRHISSLSHELLETKKSYQEWKQKTKSSAEEIRQSIDQQFGLWHLSHSEKDVALLLIKGLSMKEIADIRQTHEKTVRQQATTIYRKSGLSGRQELAAFFLEDILSIPAQPT